MSHYHKSHCHKSRCHAPRCHMSCCHKSRCHKSHCYKSRCHKSRCHMSQVTPLHVMLSQVTLSHFMLSHVILSQVTLSQVMLSLFSVQNSIFPCWTSWSSEAVNITHQVIYLVLVHITGQRTLTNISSQPSDTVTFWITEVYTILSVGVGNTAYGLITESVKHRDSVTEWHRWRVLSPRQVCDPLMSRLPIDRSIGYVRGLLSLMAAALFEI